ncbi:substrate-binding domain-containing protein [Aeromicrobium sp. Marseille-Q0843]|uniref:Substrate-binding domain-containing protein n=2 Tax=Aeromicrobium phoceense TaxID=2754045 RepID=A0A838XGH9_9ACTN|nr:substrate-binding domain-containing protein [Aeromicrobium phoceense]
MTVSRVLNDHPNIKPATREKVLAAIEQVNFTRSSHARALATNRTMRIGVLVDSPVEYGPNSTLRAFEAAARSKGYAVSAYSMSENPELAIDSGVMHLVTQGIDALCVIAPRTSSLELLHQQATELPRLAITAEPEEHLFTAAVDQRAGALAALDHLIGLGHRRIAHVAGPLDWVDAQARERAWLDRIASAGLEPMGVVEGDWTSNFGHWVATHDDTITSATAIFAANDQMALGLLHGLHARGVRVPEDISVVGFDDVPDSAHFLPPLTTVKQDFQALGELSLSLLLEAIEGEVPAHGAMIEPVLVVRESTAPPRT